MADSEHNSGGAKADQRDPSLAFATAVRDMWLLGASTVENAITQGTDAQGKTDGAAAAFAPYVEQMLRAGSSFRAMAEANMNALAGVQKPADGSGDMLALMTHANVIASVGGFRYWRRLAQTCAARQSSILQMLSEGAGDPGRSEEGRRALAEEFRAYLREIGDISVQEARALQSEFEKLAADVATAAGTPGEQPEYRRRWKAKP